MKNSLEEYIAEWAERTPEKVAIVSGGREITYGELGKAVAEKVEELSDKFGDSEKPYVFRSSQSIEYLIEYFALHLLQIVACPMDKDATDEEIRRVQAELDQHHFGAFDTDVLYTTGTTGERKGAIYTQKAILHCGDATAEALGFSSQTVFITTGPLNHSGCWAKVFPVMMTGATLYILEGMKDLNAFFEALNYEAPSQPTSKGKGNKVSACFLAPASIRILLQTAKERLGALKDKIDFIETGGAPLSSADMQDLAEVLPHTRLYNSLGSTECGIVSTYNFGTDKRMKTACVGLPTKYAEIKLDDGHICVKNKGAFSGYVGRKELTEEVLHDGWIHTSDLGHFDDDGMLIIEGRDSDVINVGGMKVAPTDVENIALRHPYVADCICIPEPHQLVGNVLKLLVVVREEFKDKFSKRELALFIGSQRLICQPHDIEIVEKINRTFNGKLDRKSYLK